MVMTKKQSQQQFAKKAKAGSGKVGKAAKSSANPKAKK